VHRSLVAAAATGACRQHSTQNDAHLEEGFEAGRRRILNLQKQNVLVPL
jgi:hypothetical protein